MEASLALDSGELALRVVLATVLAALVGLEREISGQPAGFRTHIVLALGAALFGLISVHAFDPFTDTRAATNVQVDPTRVASQVAAGVGFLGAGAILKQPGGSIRGLTTAASLWVTAAIGLAVGLGFYEAAVAVTLATLVSLFGLRGVRRGIRRRLARDIEEITIRLVAEADPAGIVGVLHGLAAVEVHELRIDRDDETGLLVIRALVASMPARRLEQAVMPLADRDDVEELVLPGT